MEGSRQISDIGPHVAASRGANLLTMAVAVLAFLVSLAGLLLDGVYGEPASVAERLRGYDLVTALVVVPVLIFSQLWARQGSDRAQLVRVALFAYLALHLRLLPLPDLLQPALSGSRRCSQWR
jgi:hypothetical protein